ncbi:MAG TPA: hypothetical protein QF772_01440, partial [Nitrospinaceae bacterium]|nr:hypothetical protein [Nitrospinaceae bacterium]
MNIDTNSNSNVSAVIQSSELRVQRQQIRLLTGKDLKPITCVKQDNDWQFNEHFDRRRGLGGIDLQSRW